MDVSSVVHLMSSEGAVNPYPPVKNINDLKKTAVLKETQKVRFSLSNPYIIQITQPEYEPEGNAKSKALL